MSITLDPETTVIETPVVRTPKRWDEMQRDKVADAASVLDEHKPGWYRKVNTDTLDMRSIHNCVLGQVFGPRFFREYRPSGYGVGMDFLHDRGYYNGTPFCLPADGPAWIEEIENRRTR